MRLHSLLFLVVLAGSLLTEGCRNKQKKTETGVAADSVREITDADGAEADAPVSERLETLLGSEEGLFRGVNLGDPVSAVKAAEKADLFETTADHLGYSIEYPNLETTDVLYYFDKSRRVTKIDVDMYLNNRQSVDATRQELTDYFNGRYGKAVAGAGETKWKTSANIQITLADVSKKKDFGIKLTFAPGNAPVTAGIGR